MTTRLLTATDDGSSVDVAVGEAIRLDLPENPTTGYQWDLEENASLSLVSTSYVPRVEPAVGGGGTRQFIVSPTTQGESTLSAVHRRAWGGDQSVIGRVSILIRAK